MGYLVAVVAWFLMICAFAIWQIENAVEDLLRKLECPDVPTPEDGIARSLARLDDDRLEVRQINDSVYAIIDGQHGMRLPGEILADAATDDGVCDAICWYVRKDILHIA